MSENKHSVAMFKQIDGERKQIGWASPVNPGTGGRTFERSPEFLTESLDGVSFEDDEQSQQFAAEHEGEEADLIVDHNTVIEPTEQELEALKDGDEEDEASLEDEHYPQEGDEGKDSAPLQVENNETVELDAGGAITDVADEDEEAAFERELAEEQAREAAAADAPQSRREARENEESN